MWGGHIARARYFSPTLGRWISRDPAGYVDGLNLYAGYFAPNGLDPLGLMLVAVDGTSSGEFLYGQNGMLGAPRTSTGRFRSHVRNFYQDYRGPKAYWNGPANFRTGSDSSDIHRGVISWITSILEKNPNEPIDMVGHSRGGYIAMEVARELKEKGLQVFVWVG